MMNLSSPKKNIFLLALLKDYIKIDTPQYASKSFFPILNLFVFISFRTFS